MNLVPTIQRGIDDLGMVLPDIAPPLADFIVLIERWNRVHNLTAVRELSAMIPRHLLDSLAILPWLCGPSVLDVGSGAGLPGIPLALARPEWQFTLLDNSLKRVRFLRQVVAALALENVTVIHSRIEDFQPNHGFHCVTARAFAPLSKLISLTAHLCITEGRLLAMQGQHSSIELSQLPPHYRLHGVHRLDIPGLDAERHVVELGCNKSAMVPASPLATLTTSS